MAEASGDADAVAAAAKQEEMASLAAEKRAAEEAARLAAENQAEERGLKPGVSLDLVWRPAAQAHRNLSVRL